MEQALEQQHSVFGYRTHKAFQGMIIASLLLHLGIFICLISTSFTPPGGRSVAFIDLTMSSPVAVPQVSISPKAEEPVPPVPTTVTATPDTPTPELDHLQETIDQNLEAAGTGSSAKLQQASLGLSATRGYFRSLAQGETLRDDIQIYYFEILQNINEKWWLDQSMVKKEIKEVILNIVIARDGTIVANHLIRSSGSTEYDRAILKALETTGPLPPLPQTYDGDFFLAPIRLVAPLNLLAS